MNEAAREAAELYSVIVDFKTRELLGEVYLRSGRLTVCLSPSVVVSGTGGHSGMAARALANRLRAVSDAHAPLSKEAFHAFVSSESNEVGLTYPRPLSERVQFSASRAVQSLLHNAHPPGASEPWVAVKITEQDGSGARYLGWACEGSTTAIEKAWQGPMAEAMRLTADGQGMNGCRYEIVPVPLESRRERP